MRYNRILRDYVSVLFHSKITHMNRLGRDTLVCISRTGEVYINERRLKGQISGAVRTVTNGKAGRDHDYLVVQTMRGSWYKIDTDQVLKYDREV